jgi:hypothetical protein
MAISFQRSSHLYVHLMGLDISKHFQSKIRCLLALMLQLQLHHLMNNHSTINPRTELFYLNFIYASFNGTARDTTLQAGRSRDLVQIRRIFNWPNPSSCTMALGSTQPPTEMSTTNLLGVKGGLGVRLTTSSPSVSGCVVVKTLCYTPEGRGFESRWGGYFKLT